MGEQEQGSQYQPNFAQIQLALKGGRASARMRQSEEWVPSRQEITGLFQCAMGLHAYNPSTEEVEPEGRVQGYPQLRSEYKLS